ncbi:hypothetical protein, partial [Klebsiella pneumoniae]|uniref:hypothetical protein n=1 Tax=Klebsiella pneumoniae TaxID=573 RepID=UPI001E4169D9
IYTLFWKYNSHGKVIEEIDALGRIITRRYDDNDNLIYEEGPRSDCRKHFKYDAMNRLISEEEIHDDGVRLVTRHCYDHLGNRIRTYDPYDNETCFEYDAFGRMIKVIGPPKLNVRSEVVRPE